MIHIDTLIILKLIFIFHLIREIYHYLPINIVHKFFRMRNFILNHVFYNEPN